MKKLTLKVIGGVFLGTTTIGACTLGVSQFLKANDNNIYGFYNNQDLPVEKSVALIDVEESVREANAKVDAAKEEVQKKTEAKENAVKNLETAKNAVKNAEQKKKDADDEVQKAVTTKNAAEETLKNAEEAKRKAEEQVKTAKTDEERQAAEEAKKLAEEEACKAEEVRKAAEAKVKAAEEEAQKAEEARKLAEEEAQKAEETKKLAEEEARKAEEARKLAEEEAQKAEEAKKLAEKEARKAEEVRKAAEKEAQRLEAAQKAQEEAQKSEEAEAAKKATAQQVAETESIVEEKVPSVTQSNSTPNIAEDSSASTEDVVAIIKNAIQKTEEAKSLTIRNVKEQWTKEYDKSKGTELIVYYNGGTIPTGVLYSYTNTSNGKQVSLFKNVSTTNWSIPDINSIKGLAGWEMQFSGKRTVGVIELELVKKLRFLINATPLSTSSLNGNVYKDMGSNIKFYRVAVSNKQFNEWLSTYYSDKLATDTVMIDIGINSNGYICYLKARVLGDNKTRNFEIVLANADSTKVPTADELNLSDNDVLELEKAYKKNYDCDIEWAKDKEGKDYYYWVCGPNKHVNQHDF